LFIFVNNKTLEINIFYFDYDLVNTYSYDINLVVADDVKTDKVGHYMRLELFAYMDVADSCKHCYDYVHENFLYHNTNVVVDDIILYSTTNEAYNLNYLDSRVDYY